MPEVPESLISQPAVVLVEGNEDKRFFGALVKRLNLDTFQVFAVGGKAKFAGWLRAIKSSPGFATVRHLIVIRDADEDPKAAFQSIRTALINAGLPAPERPLASTGDTRPVVTIAILPGGDRPGKLEDLCLESVNQDPAFSCLDEYFKCLESCLPPEEFPQDLSKAKVHAFLASRREPDLRLGEAAEKGYWPLDSESFTSIKELLRKIGEQL